MEPKAVRRLSTSRTSLGIRARISEAKRLADEGVRGVTDPSKVEGHDCTDETPTLVSPPTRAPVSRLGPAPPPYPRPCEPLAFLRSRKKLLNPAHATNLGGAAAGSGRAQPVGIPSSCWGPACVAGIFRAERWPHDPLPKSGSRLRITTHQGADPTTWPPPYEGIYHDPETDPDPDPETVTSTQSQGPARRAAQREGGSHWPVCFRPKKKTRHPARAASGATETVGLIRGHKNSPSCLPRARAPC